MTDYEFKCFSRSWSEPKEKGSMACSGLFGSEFYSGAPCWVSFYEPTFLKRLDQIFWPSVCKFFNNGVSFDWPLCSLESYEDIEVRDAGPGDSWSWWGSATFIAGLLATLAVLVPWDEPNSVKSPAKVGCLGLTFWNGGNLRCWLSFESSVSTSGLLLCFTFAFAIELILAVFCAPEYLLWCISIPLSRSFASILSSTSTWKSQLSSWLESRSLGLLVLCLKLCFSLYATALLLGFSSYIGFAFS